MTAPLSPTSDFVEDSCVSEDNISSTNSTSDQSIGVYCTESPTKSTYSLTYHTSSLMKNRRQSPSLMSTTSTSSEIGSPIYEHHYNSSADSKLLSSPASTASIASTNSYSSGTPHQHFHKKYLREEHVKTMREIGGGGGSHNGHLLTPKQEYTTIKLENGDNIKSEYCSSPSPTYEMTTSYERMVGNGGQSNKSTMGSTSNNASSSSSSNNSKSANAQKQKHPTNVPYDPLVHITSKPPYSFSSLIFMAIEDSQQKALPVKEIYAWIVMHFPYFKTAPTGWKNSVRHNLSLNKCFQKVEKAAVSKTSTIIQLLDLNFWKNLQNTVIFKIFGPFIDLCGH
jgi:Forkhead domain